MKWIEISITVEVAVIDEMTAIFRLYNISWGDRKSHPPKVYFFMQKSRHIIQFTLQYK